MTRTKSVLRALLGVGAAGAIAAFGTFSAFSSTTDNPSNKLTTGTVALGQNGNGQAIFNDVQGVKPGTPIDRCVKVTYTGTLDADVKLYLPTASLGTLADHLELTVTPGVADDAAVFPSCGAFAASGAAVWGGTATDTLSAFRAAHNSWANGLAVGGVWTTSKTVAYRFRLTAKDTAAQNAATSLFAVNWEAQNR